MKKQEESFSKLIDIVEYLRSEKGCPWDKEQTHESIRKGLIEETYEVIEAIDNSDMKQLCEELGDLLLQIVFHAQLAKEKDEFDMQNIIEGIIQKMITRHPHVFGDIILKTASEVKENWEKLKKTEKNISKQTDVLKNVPVILPALIRSYKVQKKAALIGFDWDKIEDVLSKLYEEADELKEAIKKNDQKEIEEELGDLMFSCVNISRFTNVYPETALTKATEKFIRRFEDMENMADKKKKNLKNMTLTEMDELWNKVKLNEKEK